MPFGYHDVCLPCFVARELKVLRSGGLIFGILALHANIGPLFTTGYMSLDLEGLGFLFFIGCLVYIVAHRFFQNEKNLLTLEHELETARQIQSFILPQKMEKIAAKSLKLAPSWGPSPDWQEANRCIDLHAYRYRTKLKPALTMAQGLCAQRESIFPLLNDLCTATCPWCPEPCCLDASPLV